MLTYVCRIQQRAHLEVEDAANYSVGTMFTGSKGFRV